MIVEILIATGLRISEIFNLKYQDLDIQNGIFKIKGKGNKERIIYINNTKLKDILIKYLNQSIHNKYLFINNRGEKLSEQSIRFMIKNTVK